MKKLITLSALLSALAFPSISMAHDDAVLGAIIGGATGAMVGNSLGGRDSVIIWSAIGSAAGAAIAQNRYERDREVVVVREREPARYIVRERPVYQRTYYVAEEPRYWYPRGHRHHHHDDDD